MADFYEPLPLTAEIKTFPFALFTKDNIKGERTRAGIFAVMGNRDNVGDRVQNGAFEKTWREGKHNIVHLWDHGESETTIPTAAIDDLYEIAKSDIPEQVLQLAPDATGAAVVVRTYIKSHLGDHFVAAIDSGAIKQMSFAYAIPTGKAESIVEDVKGQQLKTRVLKEVKQYDTSDVRWGANGATIAQLKSLYGRRNDPEADYQLIETFLTSIKNGRREFAGDMKTLELIHSLAGELIAMRKSVDPPTDDAAKLTQDFQFQMAMAKARLLTLNA